MSEEDLSADGKVTVAKETAAALAEATNILHSAVDTFEASPVFHLHWWQFMLGLTLTHVTMGILAGFPEHGWIWHVVIGFFAFPFDRYCSWKLDRLGFEVEFCNVTRIVIWVTMISWLFLPSAFSMDVKAKMFRALCAFCGPLAGSVFLYPNANALVPHNFHELCGLFTHLSPVVSCYLLRFHRGDPNSWTIAIFGPHPLLDVDVTATLGGASIGFLEYCQWPLVYILMYAVFHSSVLLAFGIAKSTHEPEWQIYTSYYAEVGHVSRKKTGFSKLIGQIGSGGNETLRFLKYELLADARLCCLVFCTYLWFKLPYKPMHALVVACIFVKALMNGADWFAKKMEWIDHVLDVPRNKAEKALRKATAKADLEHRRKAKAAAHEAEGGKKD